MSPVRQLSHHRKVARRGAVLGAATLALATALAACGSSGANAGPTSATSTSAAGSSSSGGPLSDTVAQLMQPVGSFTYPADPIKNVSALSGKTVYFIPITQQAPQFGIEGTALSAGLAKAGIKVQTCDGNSNPSDINKCVGQATGAHAGAIVMDAVPYVLASNSLDAARGQGIPVLIVNQVVDPKYPASKDLGYVGSDLGSKMLQAAADWIADDSGGSADVLMDSATDSPSSIAYGQAAQDELAKQCPGCKMTVNKIQSANFSLIAPSTSSALLKTPGVNYVVSEYDQFLQPVYGGVQQAGKTTAVKGVSSAAGMSGLQMLKNKQFLSADVGASPVFEGWAEADAALRLMSGQSVPDYDIPVRLFTRDNVGSLDLSSAAENSGAWYGPTDYAAGFTKVWGVS